MRTDHIAAFNGTLEATRDETDALIAQHEAELERLRLFRQVLGQLAAQDGPDSRPDAEGRFPRFLRDRSEGPSPRHTQKDEAA